LIDGHKFVKFSIEPFQYGLHNGSNWMRRSLDDDDDDKVTRVVFGFSM